jgi:hypothetical protein
MRYIIIHKTNAHWEAGEPPTPGLVARVGKLIGELNEEKKLLAGDGLRATSHGVRLQFTGGTRTATPGPFEGKHELTAGFSVIAAASIDDAVAWASQQASILGGDLEMDVRPVTEAWDIGLMPEPDDATKRWMVLRKATEATEAETPLSAAQDANLARLIADSAQAEHHTTVTMRASKRGRRYKSSAAGVTFTDGPFTESKEMIAGFIIVDVASLDEVDSVVRRYLAVVETHEVDVLELA